MSGRPVSSAALWMALAALLWLASGCAPAAPTPAPVIPTLTAPAVTIAPAAAPTITAAPTAVPTPTALPPSPTPIAFYEPAGCLAPEDEEDAGETVEINGWTLDRRTVTMLEHAQALYGGPVNLLAGVTQGSYHDNGAASFGTHLGGGAVDLSIFLPNTWTPDYPGLLRLVRAMRAAGFAAWVRDLDEVYPGSGMHIHAIALGDPRLSAAAVEQLSGPAGYLRGFNGLPVEPPIPDRYGGPLLCAWMIAAGYADLRAAPQPSDAPPNEKLTRLKAAADQAAGEGAAALAARLGTVPAYLDGPLAGWLLREAGLLPPAPNPARKPLNYLLSPEREEAFWTWFPPAEYRRLAPDDQAGAGDLDILPGDLIILRQGTAGQAARLLAAVPAAGIWPQALFSRPDGRGGWQLDWLLLDDPGALLAAGGYQRLEILRRVDLAAAGYRTVEYAVQPGDTLPVLAERFGVDQAELLAANPGLDAASLQVGRPLIIP